MCGNIRFLAQDSGYVYRVRNNNVALGRQALSGILNRGRGIHEQIIPILDEGSRLPTNHPLGIGYF
ncbi:hypothetical protein D3C81_1269830 [compost metagenome]